VATRGAAVSSRRRGSARLCTPEQQARPLHAGTADAASRRRGSARLWLDARHVSSRYTRGARPRPYTLAEGRVRPLSALHCSARERRPGPGSAAHRALSRPAATLAVAGYRRSLVALVATALVATLVALVATLVAALVAIGYRRATAPRRSACPCGRLCAFARGRGDGRVLGQTAEGMGLQSLLTCTLPPSNSLIHTHPPPLTLTHTLTHSSLPHTHPHTHTLTLTRTLSLSRTHTHCLSLSLTHSLTAGGGADGAAEPAGLLQEGARLDALTP
jgi:hypothetical protein